MSRTHAHVPLRIRVARGDLDRVEVHDHTSGICDLPNPFDLDALQPGHGHCHWTWLWDGRGVCPCQLCHGGEANRRERRAERQRVRHELNDAARYWQAGDGD